MPYKDPVKRRECERRYKARHREQISARSKAYYAKNHQIFSERGRNYYLKHREEIMSKAIAQGHVKQAWNRAYYDRNKERIKANNANYRKLNPQVDVKHAVKRRMQINATIESETAITDFIKLVRNSRRIACYYCGKMISGKKAHIDHVVPLSRGGGHRPDNICASCPSCNMRKHSMLLSEWRGPPEQKQQLMSF